MTDTQEPILCLVMILGDESRVIRRALETMSPFIDYWVIHCNGKKDDTADIVEAYFKEKGIPGELERNDWVDFGYNRSKVMEAAYGKAKYLLLADADFILVPKNPRIKQLLKNSKADSFEIRYEGGNDYRQVLCVSGKLKWEYVGLTHEYIKCVSKEKGTEERCDWFTFDHIGDGGCKADKAKRDIGLCLRGLEKEPHNTRYMFYLANSYRDDGDYENALKWYEKRGSYTGAWYEETYIALTEAAKMMKHLNQPFDKVLNTCLKAFYINPQRKEAIFHAVEHLRLNENYHLGYEIGKLAAKLDYPIQKLFIDVDIHVYRFFFEYSICCFYTNHYKEAAEVMTKLLDEDKMPANYKEQTKNNLQLTLQRLNEMRLKQLEIAQKQMPTMVSAAKAKASGKKGKRH